MSKGLSYNEAKTQLAAESPQREQMQSVWITLSDGRKGGFTGKVLVKPGGSLHVTQILFTEPRDLPEGASWQEDEHPTSH